MATDCVLPLLISIHCWELCADIRHFSISFLHNDVNSRLREQINICSKFIPNGDGIVTPS
jgi:hypothetical protein